MPIQKVSFLKANILMTNIVLLVGALYTAALCTSCSYTLKRPVNVLNSLTSPVQLAIADLGAEGRCPNVHQQLLQELKTNLNHFDKIKIVSENSSESWVLQIRTVNCSMDASNSFVQWYTFNFGNNKSVSRGYLPSYLANYEVLVQLWKKGAAKPLINTSMVEGDTYQIRYNDPTWTVPPQTSLVADASGSGRPQITFPAPAPLLGDVSQWRRYGSQTQLQAHWGLYDELSERQAQRIEDRIVSQVVTQLKSN